jgi:hypothetical protein
LKNKAVFVAGQLEKSSDGIAQVQFCVNFPKNLKKRLAGMKKIDARIHWESTRDSKKALAFSTIKEVCIEGPWEFGIMP